MPRGGATAVGAVGYALAAEELAAQCRRAGVDVGLVVLADRVRRHSGRAGRRLVGSGLPWQVVGASVSRPAEQMRQGVLALAARARTCSASPHRRPDVDLRDLRGPGFGVPSERTG